jgi:D-beta-D-heptose 7-phosphate kinase/D-beta-D-heptose 1-phosphate adenosyltransferase
MLRIDHEKMLNSATETAQALQNKVLSSFDIIAISDYAKGYISMEILYKIFSHKSEHCKVIIDPKGKDWIKYKNAFLVKPNISELGDVLHTSIENKDQVIKEAGQEIINQYNFSNLLVTRGSKGMTLINKNEAIHFPTKKVDVFDVSGAGDTSLAALIDSISKGSSLHKSIEIANIASSYVVTKSMTYALSRAELDILISQQ